MPPPPRKPISKGPPPRVAGPPPRKPSGPAIPKRTIFRAAEQGILLDVDKSWEEEWKQMPEFKSDKMMPFHTINIHFENRDDLKGFEVLIDQPITEETKAIWHPKKKILKVSHLRYKSEQDES